MRDIMRYGQSITDRTDHTDHCKALTVNEMVMSCQDLIRGGVCFDFDIKRISLVAVLKLGWSLGRGSSIKARGPSSRISAVIYMRKWW